MEVLGYVWARTWNMSIIALRYFNVFGPRQELADIYAAVIQKFMCALRGGYSPVVHGNGKQTRDFCYVDDAVAATLRALAGKVAGFRASNIAGGQPVSVLEVLFELESILRTGLTPEYVQANAWDVQHSWADLSMAELELGYVPRVPWREGLRRTVKATG